MDPVFEICGNGVTYGDRVIVRNSHYGRSYAGIERLFEVAKRDFPFLVEEDVEVVIYGGSRISGYMGIEFNVPKGAAVPATYNRISRLESTK